MVVIAHSSQRIDHAIPEWLYLIFSRCNSGVEVFFVISGFIITLILLKEKNETVAISIRQFYFRRAFRILPPVYVFLITLTLLAAFKIITLTSSEVLTSAFFVRNHAIESNWYTGHLYTLSIEEQFYLLWPLVLIAVPTRFQLKLFVILCLLAPVWKAANYAAFGGANINRFRLDFYYGGLVTGAVLAILWMMPKMREHVANICQIRRGLPILALAIFPCTLAVEINDPRWAVLFVSVRAVCIAVVIASLVSGRAGLLGEFFELRLVKWLGAISYSLYLWQQLIIGNSKNASFQAMTISIVGVFIVASASYYFVEQPSLRLRLKIESKQKLKLSNEVAVT